MSNHVASNRKLANSDHPNSSKRLQSTPESVPHFTSQNVQSHFASGTRGVLLGIAMIRVYHLGQYHSARVLLDPGSEASFVSEKFLNLFKIPS